MKGDRETGAPPLPSHSDDFMNCCISHLTPVSSQISHACYLQILPAESLAERPSANPPESSCHPQTRPSASRAPQELPRVDHNSFPEPSAEHRVPCRQQRCQQMRDKDNIQGMEKHPTGIGHTGNEV